MLESEEKEEKKHLGFLNWEGISKEGQSKKSKRGKEIGNEREPYLLYDYY